MAQVVPGTVAFEGMSFLYSMQVSHHRLIAKIGKSSRYKDFSKRGSDGEYQYMVDLFIAGAGLEGRFRQGLNPLFTFYEGLAAKDGTQRSEIIDYFKTKSLPYDHFCELVQGALRSKNLEEARSEELTKAYERTLQPMLLDAARHILPLATISATAALVNGQSVQDLLLQGYTTPRGESLAFTELLRRELEPGLGPLIGNVDPGSLEDMKRQRSHESREFLTRQREAKGEKYTPIRDITPGRVFEYITPLRVFQDDELPAYVIEAYPRFTRIVDAATGFKVEVATEQKLPDLVAAIIEEGDPHVSLGAAHHIAEKMPDSQQREVALRYAATEFRKNRRHKPGRAFEAVNFEVSLIGVPIGELRDLRRHRMQTNLEPNYFSPGEGFYIAPAIAQSSLGEKLLRQYEAIHHLYDTLAEKINPETASLALPLATKVTMNILMNYRQAHHFIELRTQPGAHSNYSRLCQMLYVGMKQQFPLVKDTITYVNKETEVDFGRAVQELRQIRKNK